MNIESSDERRRDVGEYTCRAGAEILKARIEAYWRERGYEIVVTLVQAAFNPAVRAARYDVRSELTNGLPRASSKMRATTH
jgi:hypothetical protein